MQKYHLLQLERRFADISLNRQRFPVDSFRAHAVVHQYSTALLCVIFNVQQLNALFGRRVTFQPKRISTGGFGTAGWAQEKEAEISTWMNAQSSRRKSIGCTLHQELHRKSRMKVEKEAAVQLEAPVPISGGVLMP